MQHRRPRGRFGNASFERRNRLRPVFLLPFALLASPAFAEEVAAPAGSPEPDAAAGSDDDIVVIANRIRGQLDVSQPPVMTLDEGEIASYGADSISDLIEAVSPQTSSGRGRGGGHPVMLLNGQRISSFRELRSIPPEAIRRMEVLPEEVALRFGYPPNQRVINFILKDDFSSKQLAGEYNVPTRGGFAEYELEGGLLNIDGPRRLNVEAKLEDTSLLTEAERNVIQTTGDIPTVATDPDPAAFRSLVDASRELTFNTTWSTGLGEEGAGGSLSINGAVTRIDTRSLFGLDTVLLAAPDGSTARRSLSDPLTRTSGSTMLETGLAFTKPIGGWLLTATLDASHSDTKTVVDRERDIASLVDAAAAGTLPITGPLPAVPPAGADRARSKTNALTSLATFAGEPFRMPAGPAALTLNAGFAFNANNSTDTRTAVRTRLKRGDLSAGANIALPVTSRREGVLGAVGDVSLNFSGGVNHLSDFGTLTDWSAGLTWAPTEKLSFQASYIVNEAAPSLSQLGNPTLLSFNVPVYDFTRGEAVRVTIVNGGNPALTAERQRDLKISANWELPFLRRSNLIVEYFRNRSNDVTQDFPLLTPAIEAAFPDRVVRDASGRLVSIDRRPVTFSELESSRLRWGLNLSGGIGKEPEGGEGRGAGRGGHGGGFMGRGGGRGRWNLSLYHTVRFTERATISPTGPVLDLLGGDALTTGGVPRHQLELEGGVFHKGFGLRLDGRWSAPADVRSTGLPGSADLRFGSTFVLDARLFVNFDRQKGVVEAVPFLKGARLAFEFDNIFDSRQKVTDANGLVPIAYQADYRDPRGRFVGIDFRKMF